MSASLEPESGKRLQSRPRSAPRKNERRRRKRYDVRRNETPTDAAKRRKLAHALGAEPQELVGG